MAFQTKTYACKFLLQFGVVDQYGLMFVPYKEEAFESASEAITRRVETCTQNQWNHLWVPNDAPHSYCEARVTYREDPI